MEKRQNLIVIICDSLRPDYLPAYGADFIPTPNLDRLAEEGVTFDNAITASTVCAPARASIVTGQPVSRHDYWTNEIGFKPDARFFPERLNEAGYFTCSIGSAGHAPDTENTLGYQYIKPFGENKPDSEYLNRLKERHPEATRYAMNDGYHFKYTEAEHYDRYECDLATEFLSCYAEKKETPAGDPIGDKPLFMSLEFIMPHAPYTPPKEVAGTVDMTKIPTPKVLSRDSSDIPAVERYRRGYLTPIEAYSNPDKLFEMRMQKRLAYCEMIAAIDRLVGRVVDSLKENGLYDNTTIIFTSDHGSMEDDYDLETKGPYPYRPQLFVPLIISNHPSLKRGTHSDLLCGNFDIGATALDLAGDHGRFGLSRSLLGMLDGSEPEREVTMSEFCDSCKTLIDKRYTFTYYPFTGKATLFDRLADPEESRNIGELSENADIMRRFMMQLVDMLVLAKGVRIEAHDLTPEIQAGIAAKDPKFLDEFDIAYPLPNQASLERLRAAGLSDDYNEFCKGREIKRHYGVYFK